MKTKFKLSRHLIDKFYVYIIFLILVPVLASYFIKLKTKPKDYETFGIFTETNFKQDTSLKDYLLNIVPEDLVVNTYSCPPTSDIFFTMYDGPGSRSDLLILSETTLSKIETFAYFLELDSSNTYYSDSNYSKNGTHYGIVINDSTKSYLSDYLDYKDDTYYLFINKNSCHLNGFKDTKTDQVSRVLEKIYEEK